MASPEEPAAEQDLEQIENVRRDGAVMAAPARVLEAHKEVVDRLAME